MNQRLNQSNLKAKIMSEEKLQFKINELNAIMRKMKDEGYRFVVIEGKTKVAWLKVGGIDGKA